MKCASEQSYNEAREIAEDWLKNYSNGRYGSIKSVARMAFIEGILFSKGLILDTRLPLEEK